MSSKRASAEFIWFGRNSDRNAARIQLLNSNTKILISKKLRALSFFKKKLRPSQPHVIYIDFDENSWITNAATYGGWKLEMYQKFSVNMHAHIPITVAILIRVTATMRNHDVGRRAAQKNFFVRSVREHCESRYGTIVHSTFAAKNKLPLG